MIKKQFSVSFLKVKFKFSNPCRPKGQMCEEQIVKVESVNKFDRKVERSGVVLGSISSNLNAQRKAKICRSTALAQQVGQLFFTVDLTVFVILGCPRVKVARIHGDEIDPWWTNLVIVR